MENNMKRSRHTKATKVPRKSRATPSGSGSSHSTLADRFRRVSCSSPRPDPNRLDDLIDNLTSEPDDASIIVRNRSSNNLVDPDSPPANENRPPSFPLPMANPPASRPGKFSKSKKKNPRPSKERDYSPVNREKETELMHRRKSLGDERRYQLTECMEYYRACLESAQQFHSICMNDETSKEQRKQYATALWYELKTFFRGVYTVDEAGVKMEHINLEQQRRRQLNEFYVEFSQCDFECSPQQPTAKDTKAIERRLLSDNHLNYCSEVEKSIGDLFGKWDEILLLFPSHAALAQYDKRFDPTSKEGRMFYEKLSVFQAWFNLNSEINRLIGILGRIMACSQCQSWPNVSSAVPSRANENASRPPTPSSTSSVDVKEMNAGSPSNSSSYFLSQPTLKQQYSSVSNASRLSTSSSFSTTPETNARRLTHIASVASMDLNSTMLSTQPLTEFYHRYVDDQLTHARIELIASIFRSKHGPLLQRLRYVLRKDQTTMSHTASNNLPTTFDTAFKYYPIMSSNAPTFDMPIDRSPDGLMEEFLALNKQLQQLKNPKLMNKLKKTRAAASADQVTNILGRFDQNPTLTSSTFAPASAPTLVLRILTHDRSVLKRQSYFLDYLDATLFPHLPGSTLFPDPCTFLDKLTFTSYSQTTNEEMTIINKMLAICYRLYDKHVWMETGKCSDMFELFHLPSLYPQYVFLVQIPLDLMFAWYKYHQDRKMEQTSTTGALLLLIDECKVLIHSATLIRQYIKIMTVDVFEKSEVNLIGHDLIQFDKNVIATIDDVMKYIEDYIRISLRSNLFHNCIILLRDQWKSLKRYATAMNVEETLGDRFLQMFAKVIENYRDYLDVFHVSTNTPAETNKAEYIKKKIQKKYQKKLAMDILREAKAIYEDCAVATNIYLQKPVCRRFLLILKTAGFERIRFESKFSSVAEDPHPMQSKTNRETSTCLLFAPAEYFENSATKLQLARTLSSSFRINTTLNNNGEPSDDPQQQPAQGSPPSTQPTSNSTADAYVLCVPIASELENEWRGVTHTISTSKSLNLSLPLYTTWKTTTIFLLSQSAHLDKFEESFRDRLSKTNVQQNDLYNFDTKSGQTLQKRSCFEKVDEAMHKLAHAILNLSHQVAKSVQNFELLIEQQENRAKGEQTAKIDIRHYVHTEELAFAFTMDLIREASQYATQLDHSSLRDHAEVQLSFASIWLNFVQKKKSINNTSRSSRALPMWLLPGVHFLRHACSLQFTRKIDDAIFDQFYEHMRKTFRHLYDSKEHSTRKQLTRSSITSKKPSKPSPAQRTTSGSTKKKKKRRLTRIEQLERMDKCIDRRRSREGLIGRIKHADQKPNVMPMISKRMEEDLAFMKIRKFHKLNLLSRGQYATTYKCTIEANEVLCYKQYKIQHNDAQAINKVLDQLVPLIHIKHDNLIRYRGIALEYDHILFFMEYCSHGTIAQVLLDSFPSQVENRRTSPSVVCSIVDTSTVDKGIIPTNAGYAFFLESLARIYLKQLLSALSCLHKNEIIHRDIRNVNIFFKDSTKQSIKLGDVNFVYDFKFMKKQSTSIDMAEVDKIRESIVFYAPETIAQNETTTKSDIWSLGCTLVHMLTGKIPWSNPSIASSAYYWRVIDWMTDGRQPPISADFSLSKNCVDFLQKCFQHDPNLRPSADELLEHPFVLEEQ